MMNLYPLMTVQQQGTTSQQGASPSSYLQDLALVQPPQNQTQGTDPFETFFEMVLALEGDAQVQEEIKDKQVAVQKGLSTTMVAERYDGTGM